MATSILQPFEGAGGSRAVQTWRTLRVEQRCFQSVYLASCIASILCSWASQISKL